MPPSIDQQNHHITKYITDYLPGVVFRCRNTPNWTMLSISQASKLLTGYTPDELVDDNVLSYASLINTDDRDRVWREVQTAIKHNQHYENLYRINTKHGEQRWIWEKGFVEKDSSIVEGIIIDVTEQRQSELALQDSENRFLSIVNGSIEGILIHCDWQPLFVNNSLLKMLGYATYEDILALDSISALIAPDDHERVIGYAKARMKGEPAPLWYEFKALHRDGTLRSMEVKSSLIDWKGRSAILSTLIDVTQRNQAQQETEQQRQQLAHTNRLNILGEMSASIAHELNQPLTAIANRCAAVKNRIDSGNPDLAKIREAMLIIEEQAHRSGDIIEHLRSLIKTEHSPYQRIDIAELINSCIKFISMEGLFRKTTVNTNIAPQLPAVIGDPVQIQQVVLNLIRNASDAMQDLVSHKRHLTLTAIQHDDSSVQVSVSDCGTGITKESEARLFQSFFTTKHDGMGMGLSISCTIITAHNGQLWFSRNPEHGVTFRFTLPIYLDEMH